MTVDLQRNTIFTVINISI